MSIVRQVESKEPLHSLTSGNSWSKMIDSVNSTGNFESILIQLTEILIWVISKERIILGLFRSNWVVWGIELVGGDELKVEVRGLDWKSGLNGLAVLVGWFWFWFESGEGFQLELTVDRLPKLTFGWVEVNEGGEEENPVEEKFVYPSGSRDELVHWDWLVLLLLRPLPIGEELEELMACKRKRERELLVKNSR